MVLLAAPLLWGANRLWAWAPLAVIVFLLVLAWCLLDVAGRPRPEIPLHAGFIALGFWLSYVALYLLPLPGTLLAAIAPGVHEAYVSIYGIVSAAEAPYALSVERHATFQALLKYCMYAAVCFLVVMLVASRTRMKLVLAVILVSGVLQVLLAIGARAVDVQLTPVALMDGHWNVLRGTFVNRNHFAAFLAMAAAAGFGLVLAHIKRSRETGTMKTRIMNILDNLDGPQLFAGIGVLVVGAGMILSTSRGAIGALGVALVLTLGLSLVARGRQARELALIWPLGAALVAAVLWSGSRDLLERLSFSGSVLQERWVQWQSTLGLIRDHWLTGTGPGTYELAFTAYKDPDLRPLIYDHAHNDYLQLLAEQGVIGTTLLSIVVLLILYRLIHAFMTRRDALARGALFASLTGMFAMLVHSIVEFNLQIPANALYFWALAGVGLAAIRLPRGEGGEHGYGRRRSSASREASG